MSEEKNKLTEGNIWNVPNALTMMRFALIPVFIVLFLKGQMMPALGVYVLASLTDVADGYIARKYNLITNFGKLADPLADKLMVLALMVCMVIKRIVPIPCLIILAAKELLMILGGSVMLKKGIVVYSHKIGKAAQAAVVCGLVLCFFHERFAGLGVPVHLIVLWCGVALTLAALVHYGTDAVRQIKAMKEGGREPVETNQPS